MRAWPSDLRGLVLQLPAGWYELPHYMAPGERARLVELLCAGLDGLEYLVELDWDRLGDDGHAQQLSKSVVVLSLPSEVEADEELLRVLRAKLGSVRVGLLQHGSDRTWADVAWQERHLKVPLLSWLKRTLRDPGHPFARFGVAALPVDALAKLTPEPIELLVLVEGVLAHRLRHRALGMEEADWERSVLAIIAERLAERLLQLPRERLPQILDLLRSPQREVLVRELDVRELGLDLARVGLAWHEGNDVLLGPLVELVGRDEVLERLGRLLPRWAWSEAGKRALGRVTPPFVPLPRANLIVPEPDYSAWPAIVPDLEQMAHSALLTDIDVGKLEGADGVDAFRVLEQQAREFSRNIASIDGRTRQQSLFRYIESSDVMAETMRGTLGELRDDTLVEFDLARGRIHRFDAADRRFSDTTLGARFRAYLRWRGISLLIDRARQRDHVDVLIAEVERGLELTDDPSELRGALECLAGDLYATAHDYRRAIDRWTRAQAQLSVNEEIDEDDLDEDDLFENEDLWSRVVAWSCLQLRCALAWLRLDDVPRVCQLIDAPLFDRYASDEQAAEDESMLRRIELLRGLERALEAPARASATPPHLAPSPWGVKVEPAPLRLIRAAIALELEDWPEARHLVAELVHADDMKPAEFERAKLLEAHLMISSGEPDRAAATFDTVATSARERGDSLLEALALRGLAIAAQTRGDLSAFNEHLGTAINLERELGLPDADLVEFIQRGWRTVTAPETEPGYRELAEFLVAAGSASLRHAAHSAHDQRMCVVISAARTHQIPIGDLAGLLDAVESAAERPGPSGWLLRAVRELLAYAHAMADHHEPAKLARLEALASPLADGDDELLAWLRTPPTD